jgi:hypothetical protein
MSIIASRSPGKEVCDNCGEKCIASNVVKLDLRMLALTPDHELIAYHQLWASSADGEQEVEVCDLCLFIALRSAFQHLLSKAVKQ